MSYMRYMYPVCLCRQLNEDLLELRDAHAKLRETNRRVAREKERADREREELLQRVQHLHKVEAEEERKITRLVEQVGTKDDGCVQQCELRPLWEPARGHTGHSRVTAVPPSDRHSRVSSGPHGEPAVRSRGLEDSCDRVVSR